MNGITVKAQCCYHNTDFCNSSRLIDKHKERDTPSFGFRQRIHSHGLSKCCKNVYSIQFQSISFSNGSIRNKTILNKVYINERTTVTEWSTWRVVTHTCIRVRSVVSLQWTHLLTIRAREVFPSWARPYFHTDSRVGNTWRNVQQFSYQHTSWPPLRHALSMNRRKKKQHPSPSPSPNRSPWDIWITGKIKSHSRFQSVCWN